MELSRIPWRCNLLTETDSRSYDLPKSDSPKSQLFYGNFSAQCCEALFAAIGVYFCVVSAEVSAEFGRE